MFSLLIVFVRIRRAGDKVIVVILRKVRLHDPAVASFAGVLKARRRRKLLPQHEIIAAAKDCTDLIPIVVEVFSNKRDDLVAQGLKGSDPFFFRLFFS
ncbi:MAG: hypothetical protein OXC05_04795, partial [Halieaceae bacterium]|nr:hypothetical protein [Halieaceae bacterium]